ncbi:MAG TPA: magnesium transporter [Gemmatimonadales bacterium]|nr:magnesium transporter [Gemmatimonadales bacterium]
MRKTGSVLSSTVPPGDAPGAEPWEALRRLLAEHREGIQPFLASLPLGDTVRAVSRLEEDERQALLTLLPPDEAAAILHSLPDPQAAGAIEEMDAGRAAAIVEELSSDHQADLLGDLEAGPAEAILERMALPRATTARRLLSYAPDTAGGLMTAEYLAYPETGTIGDVVEDLRTHGERYAGYNVQYTFVLGADGRLSGVLRVRDLLLSPTHTPLRTIMFRDPLRVRDTASLEDLKRFFDEHPLFGVPVTDADDRLVGIVRRPAVEEALRQGATRNFLAVSGLVGEEELRTMPLKTRSARRLSWLSLNIVLNVVAASVIALYQDTLAAVVALAVFLPIISDMSGCSGSQAVAVSIRELTLGLIRPYEFMRVVVKEGAVGILNGVVLGLLLGVLAYAWKQNVFLSLVVALALSLNTVVAVLVGGLIPLLLKRLKLDPALASGPILTTVTDMCGFFFVLSFATLALSKLT